MVKTSISLIANDKEAAVLVCHKVNNTKGYIEHQDSRQ